MSFGDETDRASLMEPYAFLRAREFLAREFPRREPMLGEWLTVQSVNMLSAWRGTGKTLCACAIAAAVATGTRWLKWAARAPRTVCYIDCELPGEQAQHRIRQAFEMIDEPYDRALQDNLIIWNQSANLHRGVPNIADPETQVELEAVLEDAGCELLILDHASGLIVTRDGENADTSWQAVQGWFARLRTKGISTLIVDHHGKRGFLRGSSKKEDILDCHIALRRPADSPPDQGAHFELSFEKNREHLGAEAAALLVSIHDDGGPSWVYRDVEHERATARALKEEGQSVRRIAEQLSVSKSTVQRWLS